MMSQEQPATQPPFEPFYKRAGFEAFPNDFEGQLLLQAAILKEKFPDLAVGDITSLPYIPEDFPLRGEEDPVPFFALVPPGLSYRRLIEVMNGDGIELVDREAVNSVDIDKDTENRPTTAYIIAEAEREITTQMGGATQRVPDFTLLERLLGVYLTLRASGEFTRTGFLWANATKLFKPHLPHQQLAIFVDMREKSKPRVHIQPSGLGM